VWNGIRALCFPLAWFWWEFPHIFGFVLGVLVASSAWLALILVVFHRYIAATT